MKAALILAAASAALAQNFSGEPACATSCLSSAVVAVGCALNDQGCQCDPAKQPALTSLGAGCLPYACNISDLLLAQSVGSKLCADYSATAAKTTSGSGAASTTSSSSGGASSTTTSTSTTTAAPVTTSSTTTSSTMAMTSAPSTSTKPTSVTANVGVVATPLAVGALAAIIGAVAAL